ncbi:hypothetical protein BE11_18035 [Sorangium cellulosum]|nr:hypothetical protein BE11_18035 [Sorangium cellulosum]
MLDVTITRAPSACASCSAKMDTPPVPCTSTDCPACSFPCGTSAFQAVTAAHGSVAPSSKLMCSGSGTSPSASSADVLILSWPSNAAQGCDPAPLNARSGAATPRV